MYRRMHAFLVIVQNKSFTEQIIRLEVKSTPISWLLETISFCSTLCVRVLWRYINVMCTYCSNFCLLHIIFFISLHSFIAACFLFRKDCFVRVCESQCSAVLHVDCPFNVYCVSLAFLLDHIICDCIARLFP